MRARRSGFNSPSATDCDATLLIWSHSGLKVQWSYTTSIRLSCSTIQLEFALPVYTQHLGFKFGVFVIKQIGCAAFFLTITVLHRLKIKYWSVSTQSI